MRAVILHTTENYRLTSFGNGVGYRLESRNAFPCPFAVWLQGDDATIFRNEMEALELRYPDMSTDAVLARLFELYSDIAEPFEAK